MRNTWCAPRSNFHLFALSYSDEPDQNVALTYSLPAPCSSNSPGMECWVPLHHIKATCCLSNSPAPQIHSTAGVPKVGSQKTPFPEARPSMSHVDSIQPLAQCPNHLGTWAQSHHDVRGQFGPGTSSLKTHIPRWRNHEFGLQKVRDPFQL